MSLAASLRPAQRSDLEALSGLAVETYREAFGSSLSDDDLSAILDQSLSAARFSEALEEEEDTILVAEQGGRLTGFIQFGPVRISGVEASGKDRELRRLYVLTDHQNKGIGGALMETALADPQMSGAKAVYLDVWEHNDGARRFYERFGFEVIGRHRLEVASGAETDFDLIMVRRPVRTQIA